MAGDWIPLRKNIDRELEVMRIASLTGYSRRETAMILFAMWGWFDDVSTDGIVKGVKLDEMSALCPDVRSTFWDAVIRVGWLVCTDDSLVCPNFDRWIGKTAKKRLLDARRKANNRHVVQNVRLRSASQQDKSRTREEKRICNTPLPPALDTPEMRAAWESWRTHRAEIKKKLTPSAIEQQLAKLATMGVERAIAAIRHSIANGWQGIFEPRKGDVAPGRATESTAERIARAAREKEERRRRTESGAAAPEEIQSILRRVMPEAAPGDSETPKG